MSFLSNFPILKNLIRLDLKEKAPPNLVISRASTAMLYKNNAAATAAVDVPRFDEGSFINTSSGLLIESAKTNLIPSPHLSTTLTPATNADSVSRSMPDMFGGTSSVRVGVNYAGSGAEVAVGYTGTFSAVAGNVFVGTMFFRPVGNQPFLLHLNVMFLYGGAYAYVNSVEVTQASDGVMSGGVYAKKLPNGWWRLDCYSAATASSAGYTFKLHFFRRTAGGVMDYFDVCYPSFGTGTLSTMVPAATGTTSRAADLATQGFSFTQQSLLIQCSFIPIGFTTEVFTISDGTTSIGVNIGNTNLYLTANGASIAASKIVVAGLYPIVKNLMVLFDRQNRLLTVRYGNTSVTVPLPSGVGTMGQNVTLRLGSTTAVYSTMYEKLHVFEGAFTAEHLPKLMSMLGK